MQRLVTMRHGLRIDQVDPRWGETADRPWDPPLSEEGRVQAQHVAHCIQNLGVTQLVVSPFLRCLQTAKAIADELKQPVHWEIDCAVGEVMSQRYLTGMEAPVPSGPVSEWFWKGNSLRDAVSEELGTSDFAVAPSQFAQPPESVEQAHTRYTRAIQEIADRHAPHNTLIVTHGEAVRRSVTFVQPWAQVYEVQPCGYTLLWRAQDEDGDWDEWHLIDQSEVYGVAWSDKTVSCTNPTNGFVMYKPQ